MSVYLGMVETFREIAADKQQALKPLEEAAEVYSAWQDLDRLSMRDVSVSGDAYDDLLGECADVIQSVCNLLAALGVEDFTHEIELCRRRNADRGRI